MSRVRAAALLSVLALALVSCGASGDESQGSDDTLAQGSGSGANQAPSPGGSGNYAVVTIGGTTYEVAAGALNLCNSLDNLISGSFATDESGTVVQAGGTEASVQVNFGIPVPEWEAEGLQAPILNVDLLDEGVRWFASVDRGLGAVDSWDLSEGVASGSASFEGETVTGESVGSESGTFEIVCR